jgi:chromosome segregation ATPase
MRQIEDKWDNLKRKQTGLKVELDTLQESADAYTAIATLEEELERETEMLKDSVKESSRLLGRCNLQDFVELTPTVEDGVNSIVAAVQEKLNKAQTQLDKATDAYKKQESLVAGQSGAIIAARQNLDSLEDQFRLLEGCVAKVRLIIAKMKEMPGDINGDKLDLDKATPDELRIYLDKMFEEWSSLASGIDETLLNLVL